MMTDQELQQAARMMREALEVRLRAAELYLAAVEYIVPLVHGDTANITHARRAHGRCTLFVNSTLANLKDASPEDWHETFKESKGDPWQ